MSAVAGNLFNLFMALTRQQKQKVIEDLGEKIERQKSIVFVNFFGTKVKDISKLRKEMKEKGCELKVVKKTLLKIALKKKKIELTKELPGEIGLGFGYQDLIAPFKILDNFSKENTSLKIIGGFVGKFIGEEEAKNIWVYEI